MEGFTSILRFINCPFCSNCGRLRGVFCGVLAIRFMKQPVISSKNDSSSHTEPHKKNRLSEVILGGQDGLVNVLGVILGGAAASQDKRIVLAVGLAAVFAESISMAAVAYTSKLAERDFYYSEVEREKREMEEVPELEKQEIRQIYKERGLKGRLLEDVVKVITSDKKVWLETMISDELKLSPVAKNEPYHALAIVGISTLVGSFIPLMPFVFLSIRDAIYVSLIISAGSLFLVGAVKAKLTVGFWFKTGLQMMIIGIFSALAGYFIGSLFTSSP